MLFRSILRLSLSLLGLAGSSLVPAAAQAGDAPASTRLEVSFSYHTPADLPVRGILRLRSLDGKAEAVRLEIGSSAPVSVPLPPSSAWEVAADIPGFWVRRQTVEIGPAEQLPRVSLELWPLGTISGVVKLKEKKAPLPEKLLVRTLTSPDFAKRPTAPMGALDCPVDEKGNWSCSLPAATFDLAISAEGLTPQYRWGVNVPTGKALPLGVIELERGASVAGWVAVEGGTIDPGACIARLSPLVAGAADLKSVISLAGTTREQQVRKDGFLQLTGLAPGTYGLEVRQQGYPPVRISPVRVHNGAETFLREPILLKRPVDLQFEISPPTDWVGKAWRARVVKLGERRSSAMVFDDEASLSGAFTVPGQSSGRYRISIQDSFGNQQYSREHRVEEADNGPQAIRIDLVSVEGRLRLGDEPLEASLWFGGRSGTTSIKMESDQDGRFHGVLPSEGLWRIQVESERLDLSTWTRSEVDAGSSGKASVDLVLPDTQVFGKVVDENGAVVTEADVALLGGNIELIASTDERGEFKMRGLPEGLVWLAAESASRMSNRVAANLVEGRAVGPLELRLKPVRRLTGKVLSSRGPVAGANVLVLAKTLDGGGAAATTGTDGTFEVELPKDAGRVEAVVSAPGFALRAFDAQAGSEPLILQVNEEGGSIEVAMPLSGDELLRRDLTLVMFQNGLLIPSSLLLQWAVDHGHDVERQDRIFRASQVAAGEYRACLVPQNLPLGFLLTSMPQGATCDSGALAAGTSVSLAPPSP